jgi:hypothetical protein
MFIIIKKDKKEFDKGDKDRPERRCIMTGSELRRKLMDTDSEGRCFIKWWRKENDFADYELIDHFLQNLTSEHEFEGFELMTMEEMWEELHSREPKRIWMEKIHGRKMLHWQHLGRDGQLREDIYRFSPEVIMALFEKETHGDTLC